MIKNNGYEVLIKLEDLETVIYNMINNINDCKPIMIDQIVKRALYKVENIDASGGNQIRWIRIMEGDIECSGETRCTITYKDKKKDMSGEDYALLKAENFVDATHLFDLLNYERTSYQENKRTKFVCVLDKIKYIVRFDIWPKIEDVVFVTVNVASSANKDDIEGFIAALELNQFDIDDNEMVDVDNEYQKRFGKPASLIPEVTFEFDLDLV
ncbi:MAG: hypothetical protein BWY15_01552 [Firmicutes bacterium ADurb.Bin193]|nr:MAG: hypothetical protein BWY15_01552 [Firmicutes bacterium ADurb.Bin193]